MSNLSRRSLVTAAAALPTLAVQAVAERATGVDHPDAELLRLGAKLEAVEQEWLAQHARDGAGEPIECDEHGDMIAWSQINDQMFGLIDKIMKYKPRTPDGLAVQARAIVMDRSEWWDKGLFADEESENGRTRLFLESTCALFGISVAAIQRAAEA